AGQVMIALPLSGGWAVVVAGTEAAGGIEGANSVGCGVGWSAGLGVGDGVAVGAVSGTGCGCCRGVSAGAGRVGVGREAGRVSVGVGVGVGVLVLWVSVGITRGVVRTSASGSTGPWTSGVGVASGSGGNRKSRTDPVCCASDGVASARARTTAETEVRMSIIPKVFPNPGSR